ncbi:MAG: DUF4093 domain-containing protein [Oscillospiraceae bacterium]|nr:DUF4093 domain-containing protein [Oscillospiraceae bacterium]
MKQVKEVIVVEGRYDKNTVSQAVNATIIEVSGFQIFSDKEKIALLRKLADKCGLIILTDGDKSGFFIRGRLKGMLGDTNIKHAYIPDIPGKERRKSQGSKEGKLGVEGMTPEVIVTSLTRAGASFEEEPQSCAPSSRISKSDLYAAGLSGGTGSSAKRRALLSKLDLPERLSAKGLLDVLNVLYSREEFLALIDEN